MAEEDVDSLRRLVPPRRGEGLAREGAASQTSGVTPGQTAAPPDDPGPVDVAAAAAAEDDGAAEAAAPQSEAAEAAATSAGALPAKNAWNLSTDGAPESPIIPHRAWTKA